MVEQQTNMSVGSSVAAVRKDQDEEVEIAIYAIFSFPDGAAGKPSTRNGRDVSESVVMKGCALADGG